MSFDEILEIYPFLLNGAKNVEEVNYTRRSTSDGIDLRLIPAEYTLPIINKMGPVELARFRRTTRIVNDFIQKNSRHIGVVLDKCINVTHVLDYSESATAKDVCLNISGKHAFDMNSAILALSGYSFTGFVITNPSQNIEHALKLPQIQRAFLKFFENFKWRNCRFTPCQQFQGNWTDLARPQHFCANTNILYFPNYLKKLELICDHITLKNSFSEYPFRFLEDIFFSCPSACQACRMHIQDILNKWDIGYFPALKNLKVEYISIQQQHMTNLSAPDPKMDVYRIIDPVAREAGSEIQARIRHLETKLHLENNINKNGGTVEYKIQNRAKQFGQLTIELNNKKSSELSENNAYLVLSVCL